MKERFLLAITVLFAMTPMVSAAREQDLHTLAIVFLALCVIVLLVAILIPVVLHRRRVKLEQRGYTGSKKASMYDLSGRVQKVSQTRERDPVSFYGIYDDPQSANSIYLPLEKGTRTENGTYANLEESKPKEDPHTYEELKKKGTFGPTYDNPGAKDDEEDDHDYELADATIVRPPKNDYENPLSQTDTAL